MFVEINTGTEEELKKLADDPESLKENKQMGEYTSESLPFMAFTCC